MERDLSAVPAEVAVDAVKAVVDVVKVVADVAKAVADVVKVAADVARWAALLRPDPVAHVFVRRVDTKCRTFPVNRAVN